MKVLHTADWHLGKRLYSKDRMEEQIRFLEELCSLSDEHQVDCILVAGDLFDAINPPNEAVEVFYRYLKKLSKEGRRPVIAIAGNHDSADRITAPNPLALECGIFFFGSPNEVQPPLQLESGLKVTSTAPDFIELNMPNWEFPLRVIATPFVNEMRLKKHLGKDEVQGLQDYLQSHWQELQQAYMDEKGANILMSHLFVSKRGGEPQEEPEGEKNIMLGTASIVYSDLFPEVDYVALGHLHTSHAVTGGPAPIHYSGSPIAYSFSESSENKVVHLLHLKPRLEKVEKIAIQAGLPLARKTFEKVSDAIQWLEQNQESLVELTMKTASYLTAAEIQSIRTTSPNVLNIVPMPKQVSKSGAKGAEIHLSMGFEELFVKYFNEKTGQEPNQEVMEMLNELRGEHETN